MGDTAEFVTRANAYNDEYILAMRNLGIDLGDSAAQVTETYLAANDVCDEAQAASLARLDAARAYREHAIKGATGRKDDAAKPDWSLLPLKATEEVVKVLTFGAKKYARDNWQLVPDGEHRYLAAALRHLAAHQAGERSDSESGESHLAHAACCVLFLIHKQLEAEKP